MNAFILVNFEVVSHQNGHLLLSQHFLEPLKAKLVQVVVDAEYLIFLIGLVMKLSKHLFRQNQTANAEGQKPLLDAKALQKVGIERLRY
jgi:hypothetical protein